MQREDRLSASLTAILNDMGIGTPSRYIARATGYSSAHWYSNTRFTPLRCYAGHSQPGPTRPRPKHLGHMVLDPATCLFEPRLQPIGPRNLTQPMIPTTSK